jgi:undecaprenyl-diphosphatase
MSIIDAIILGIVQGLTEFIPVSSSGHLVIASHILNVKDAFTFDVLLNLGTLTALIIYYRKRLGNLIVRIVKGQDWKLLFRLLVATIPAAIVGLILDKQIARLDENIYLVIVMLVIVGVLMIIIGKPKKGCDDQELEKSLKWATAVKVGVSQILAFIPGTSRSGITILAGLRSNLSAKRAAEFSFLLAIPIIGAASFKMLLSSEGREFVSKNLGTFIFGNVASLIVGLAAISFFVSILGKRGLKDFGWYRVALAVVLIVLLVIGVI